jgi:hypothetical protein
LALARKSDDGLDLDEKLRPEQRGYLDERARRVRLVAEGRSQELVTDVTDRLQVGDVGDVPAQAHDIGPVSTDGAEDILQVLQCLPGLGREIAWANELTIRVNADLSGDERQPP